MRRVLSPEVPFRVIFAANTEDTDTVLQHFAMSKVRGTFCFWKGTLRRPEWGSEPQSTKYQLQFAKLQEVVQWVWRLDCEFTMNSFPNSNSQKFGCKVYCGACAVRTTDIVSWASRVCCCWVGGQHDPRPRGSLYRLMMSTIKHFHNLSKPLPCWWD